MQKSIGCRSRSKIRPGANTKGTLGRFTRLTVAGSLSSFATIRKKTGLFCNSFLGKGKVFAYDGCIQNLKDLKSLLHWRAGSLRSFTATRKEAGLSCIYLTRIDGLARAGPLELLELY